MPNLSDLDQMADKAKLGRASYDDLVNCFLESTLAMPSASDPTLGELRPVLVDLAGVAHLVLASSGEALKKTATQAAFAITILGKDVVNGLAPGTGLLVNTQNDAFSISPDVIGVLQKLGGVRVE